MRMEPTQAAMACCSLGRPRPQPARSMLRWPGVRQAGGVLKSCCVNDHAVGYVTGPILRPMSAADWLSVTRLILVPLIWPLVLDGHGRLVGFGLILAGTTDALDGYLARRSSRPSAHGARLDAVADAVLMVSAGAWLQVLHPEILRHNLLLLGVAAATYAGSLVAGVSPKQLSSKVAGASLYTFALVTLLVGVYYPLLLEVALLVLIAASLETMTRAATNTIQARGNASKQRSHNPQASNEVGSNGSATISRPTSTAPITTEIGP